MNERRHGHTKEKRMWEQLNYAQRATANGLANVGYELAFVRGDITDSLAVFRLDESMITVDIDGDADLSPHINVR